jgi:hypothetical protein
MKPGFTTINQTRSGRVGNRSIHHFLLQRNSRCNHQQASWYWPSSGILNSLFLRPTWNVEQLSQVQPTVTCFRGGWGLQSALKEVGDCQRASCYCMTMLVPILQPAHWKLRWKVVEHPAHSLDLAPTEFHPFGLLKGTLEGRRFQCDEDVRNAVHQWLHAQPKTFYYDGIKKLVGRWEKSVDYIEKWCILFL